jgi:serine/threonine-protein kinase HipA
MIANDKEILVFADWLGLRGPQLMGRLFASRLRGKEVFQFEYEPDWIKSDCLLQIDPELGHFTGRQFPSAGRNIFGVFLDSMPDRWGRQLMLRREALLARKEGRAVNHLFESDYLLGVFDKQRQGALRYKLAGDNRFLNDDRTLAVPPLSSLRELEHASMEIESNVELDDQSAIKWINMLMAPGSSLGGARPKAGVVDNSGQLWIAKFPSKNDNADIGAWEMIISEIGRKAGLNMATGQLFKLSARHHTYLSKRFDRTNTGERMHFASAMTLLQYYDGDDFSTGASYLELADFIIRNGEQPEKDLEELWRRIVFSICVKNTDDHLRNHGFMLNNDGWKLSPAYDVNPNPVGYGLRLNISESDNSLDLDLAKSVGSFFRITTPKADEIINQVKKAVSLWRQTAKRYQISKAEMDRMEHAFTLTT